MGKVVENYVENVEYRLKNRVLFSPDIYVPPENEFVFAQNGYSRLNVLYVESRHSLSRAVRKAIVRSMASREVPKSAFPPLLR